MLFEIAQPVPGSGGHVTLFAGDDVIGEGDMPKTVPVAFSSYAGLDVGRDNGLVVDRAYEDKAPYAFTGTVHRVVFDLQPVDPDTERALAHHAAVQSVADGAAG
jgi:arylsulfatase